MCVAERTRTPSFVTCPLPEGELGLWCRRVFIGEFGWGTIQLTGNVFTPLNG